jgi:hypothetical protein
MKKKRNQQSPQSNQWLFTCPLRLSTTPIVATLGMTRSGITEVDARTWQGEWDMANTFVREYGYGEPVLSEFPIGESVNWDALRDWMFIRKQINNPTPASPNSNFVGEILILRRCRPEQEQILGFVASMVAADVSWESEKRHHPDPVLAMRPLALVLEGWEEPVLRYTKRETWIVNAWPTENGKLFTCMIPFFTKDLAVMRREGIDRIIRKRTGDFSLRNLLRKF